MITASLVTYNTPCEELDKVLLCIVKSDIAHLYVVDNSPKDNLREQVVGYGEKVEYISGQGNVGYGRGHNIGIRKAMEAGAKYHAVINPDIYFEPDVIQKIRAYMEAHEEVGQLMPKVTYPDGKIQYLCKLLPTPVDLIFRRFLPASWSQERNDRFTLKFTGYDKIMNIPYLSGSFMFFKVAALIKTGLFDERFFMYPEDIDITRRTHRLYKTIYFPEARVIHEHRAASRTSLRMLRIHMINMIKYFNKWGWIFDRERKIINRQTLKELKYNE